jgi:hypothetical protein
LVIENLGAGSLTCPQVDLHQSDRSTRQYQIALPVNGQFLELSKFSSGFEDAWGLPNCKSQPPDVAGSKVQRAKPLVPALERDWRAKNCHDTVAGEILNDTAVFAHGKYRLGLPQNCVTVEFAMEAKCYARNSGVGVKAVSRLISRLRQRQFGILVTTSYLADQAYQEIVDDEHPIVICAGGDIAELLVAKGGFKSGKELSEWLQLNYPLTGVEPKK